MKDNKGKKPADIKAEPKIDAKKNPNKEVENKAKEAELKAKDAKAEVKKPDAQPVKPADVIKENEIKKDVAEKTTKPENEVKKPTTTPESTAEKPVEKLAKAYKALIEQEKQHVKETLKQHHQQEKDKLDKIAAQSEQNAEKAKNNIKVIEAQAKKISEFEQALGKYKAALQAKKVFLNSTMTTTANNLKADNAKLEKINKELENKVDTLIQNTPLAKMTDTVQNLVKAEMTTNTNYEGVKVLGEPIELVAPVFSLDVDHF